MAIASDSATWAAVGTSASAAVLLLVALFLVIRWRRASTRQLARVQESTSRTEHMFDQLRESLETAQEDRERARREADEATREVERLRRLGGHCRVALA